METYLCSGENWSVKLKRPSIRLLSLVLVNIFCPQHEVNFTQIHDTFVIVAGESSTSCYYDGLITALRRLFCCRDLYPVLMDTFTKLHTWFCEGRTGREGDLCDSYLHFSSKGAALEIYDFTYKFGICQECSYKHKKAGLHAQTGRKRRQYSVRTFLNAVMGILESQDVPMDPEGNAVLLRQYIIVLGDMATCMTRDMMRDEDWF